MTLLTILLLHLLPIMGNCLGKNQKPLGSDADAPTRFATIVPDIRFNTDFQKLPNTCDLRKAREILGGNKSGVTIKPNEHLANPIRRYSWKANLTSTNVLNSVKEIQYKEIIQSSLGDGPPVSSSSSNGFVKAAIEAYNNHHHLKIRPEDIWLAILTQLSAYINAHAEELRGSFVAHEGKKELVIEYDTSTRFAVDFADFATKIGIMIQDNVIDPELREWILPCFSTTTEHDSVVANIVMMASMQKYFEYFCALACGLPTVTLSGDISDYRLILQRLDKLRSYGKEPTLFADLLTPVIKRFIRSFEHPDDEETKSFWNNIFNSIGGGSGAADYSGWITAFMFWDKDGKLLYRRSKSSYLDEYLPPLTLDGMTFHRITSDDVPPGYCTVPVTIIGDVEKPEIEAEMLAGSIGMEFTSSGLEMANGEPGEDRPDTMQPRSGWWIYEKAEKGSTDSLEKWF